MLLLRAQHVENSSASSSFGDGITNRSALCEFHFFFHFFFLSHHQVMKIKQAQKRRAAHVRDSDAHSFLSARIAKRTSAALCVRIDLFGCAAQSRRFEWGAHRMRLIGAHDDAFPCSFSPFASASASASMRASSSSVRPFRSTGRR